jgi:hypothetical protein
MGLRGVHRTDIQGLVTISAFGPVGLPIVAPIFRVRKWTTKGRLANSVCASTAGRLCSVMCLLADQARAQRHPTLRARGSD